MYQVNVFPFLTTYLRTPQSGENCDAIEIAEPAGVGFFLKSGYGLWVPHWHLRALQTRWRGGVDHVPAQRHPSYFVVDCMLKKIGLGVEP